MQTETTYFAVSLFLACNYTSTHDVLFLQPWQSVDLVIGNLYPLPGSQAQAEGVSYFSVFKAAHRFFCASAIFRLVAALNPFRFFGADPPAELSPPANRFFGRHHTPFAWQNLAMLRSPD